MNKIAEKEVSSLMTEISALKLANNRLETRIDDLTKKLEKITLSSSGEDLGMKEIRFYQCNLCEDNFSCDDFLREHKESVHVSNLDEELIFKCDLCDYKSKSRKGVNIHKGSKHKNFTSALASVSVPPSEYVQSQTPLNCILYEEGCPNMISSYYSKYTAICNSCSIMLENKLQSTPFSHDLCPCCHEVSGRTPLSLCTDCLNEGLKMVMQKQIGDLGIWIG